jgi:hypothetical protein
MIKDERLGLERKDISLEVRIRATAAALRARPGDPALMARLRSQVARVRFELGARPRDLGLAPHQLGVRVRPSLTLGQRLVRFGWAGV